MGASLEGSGESCTCSLIKDYKRILYKEADSYRRHKCAGGCCILGENNE